MSTGTRTQRRYDHRLKELVRSTGNIGIALESGVPRSTAYGWLKRSHAQVVSLDVHDTEMTDLQREVIQLRRRNARLIALLRLIMTVIKVAGFSLARVRISEEQHKRHVLRAIDQARVQLPLRTVLAWRVLDRFHPAVTAQLLLDASQAMSSETPTVIVDGGIENYNSAVDELVKLDVLKRVLAQTEIRYSNSMIESWWRVLKHQWLYLNQLDSLKTVEKLVAFYVGQHNSHLPHSAFKGQTLDEMYFGTGDHVPKKLEAARLAARQSRLKANRAMSCQKCERLVSIGS